MSFYEKKFTPQERENAIEMERRLVNPDYPAGDVPVHIVSKPSGLKSIEEFENALTGPLGETIDSYQERDLAVGGKWSNNGVDLFIARSQEAIARVVDTAKDAASFAEDHKKEVAIGTGVAASLIAATVGGIMLFRRRNRNK